MEKKKADQGMRGWCRRWVKRKRKKRRTDVESAQHWPRIVQLLTVVAMCKSILEFNDQFGVCAILCIMLSEH
jgi:hypothetical protein